MATEVSLQFRIICRGGPKTAAVPISKNDWGEYGSNTHNSIRRGELQPTIHIVVFSQLAGYFLNFILYDVGDLICVSLSLSVCVYQLLHCHPAYGGTVRL